MRQSTALHATRRNQVSAVVRQAKHYCVDRWKSSGGVETNELPFGPSRRDSNPCFSLERARPWVVFSPTSLPGATARCHSRARSAPGIRRLFVDLSWSTKSRANTKFRFLRLTAAIRNATQRDQWASLGRGLS